jgi:hypothetical protein
VDGVAIAEDENATTRINDKSRNESVKYEMLHIQRNVSMVVTDWKW